MEEGNVDASVQGRTEKDELRIGDGEATFPGSGLAEDCSDGLKSAPEITVSEFDYSVENHFEALDKIHNLCGEAECDELDKDEIGRFSSSITFLREWTAYNYKPRVVHFACQNETSQGKDDNGGIKLSQFSSANVPKNEGVQTNKLPPECSKDFVLYVGGPVWALDWCPRVQQLSDCCIKSEFIAVAAHPPDSCYHKIGAPLTGRGVVQVWCVLNASSMKEEEVPHQVGIKRKWRRMVDETVEVKLDQPQKRRGRPRKKPINESEDVCSTPNVQALAVQIPEGSPQSLLMGSTEHVGQPKRSRGRPRKKPINESVDDCSIQNVQALAVQVPEGSPGSLVKGDLMVSTEHVGQPKKPRGRPRKKPIIESVDDCSIQNVQPLAVQYPKGSPKSLMNGDLMGSTEHVGQPKKPINESVYDCSIQNVEALVVQSHEGSPKSLMNEDLTSSTQYVGQPKKARGRPRKKPRGRPGKKPINESVDNCTGHNVQALAIESVDNCTNHNMEALGVQCPEGSPKSPRTDGDLMGNTEHVDNNDSGRECIGSKSGVHADNLMGSNEHVDKNDSGRKCKGSNSGVHADNLELEASVQTRRFEFRARKGNHTHDNGLTTFIQNENQESSPNNPETCSSNVQLPVGFSETASGNGFLETSPSRSPIPKDVALPRIMLCLAHNGKVAWDVKWRPSDVCGASSKHRMGYLAVLLGSGALEVWDVPSPHTVKTIYSACQKDGTDPRFIKLQPVFKCSKLQWGNRQSIPLTMEWSTASPHDFIIAGCHDGTVAMWKFSASCSSQDTRPLLCFCADTVPIRALAWAPVNSPSESANLIVTAGNRGIKFWDIRDPFRPLWELNPVQRIIYSLDWLPEPRCIIASFDDGSIRVLNLMKAAVDVPINVKPSAAVQISGFNCYAPLSFAIWSVQFSRLTGMVAYCSADGTVLRFQLTTREVEKDDLRTRVPHYICGSLIEEGEGLTVITPLPDDPISLKKSLLTEGYKASGSVGGRKCLTKTKEARSKKKKKSAKALSSSDDDDPDDDDLDFETGHRDSVASQKNKRTLKSNTSTYDDDNDDDDDDDPDFETGHRNSVASQKNKRTSKSKISTCDDDDPDFEMGHRDSVVSQKNKHTPKSKSSKEGTKANEESDKVKIEKSAEGKVAKKPVNFPPKSIAMHRVRWNMNKGSERWLCYGGAAGIVRCQEI